MTDTTLIQTAERSMTYPGVGGWDVELHIELEYYDPVSGFSAWDLEHWDAASADWIGAVPTVDVSAPARSVSIKRGRDSPLDRFTPGTASVVVDDPDGIYSPWITDTAAFNSLRPGVGIRIYALQQHGSGSSSCTPFPLFIGRIETITDDWPSPREHTVTFTAVDALKLLAQAEIPAIPEAQPPWGGYTTPAGLVYMQEILNRSGVDLPFDAPGVGTVILQAFRFGDNALALAGIVTDTEFGGGFWAHAVPNYVTLELFEEYRWVDRQVLATEAAYTNVQAVFGEEAPEWCYDSLSLAVDADQVRNIVSVVPKKVNSSDPDQTPVTLSDTDSIAMYGQRTYSRDDLIHRDHPSQSTVIAQRYLDFYAFAAQRVDEITVIPSAHPEMFGHQPFPGTPTDLNILALELLWRLQLRRRAEGFQVVADLSVQNISHDISPDEWKITYGTFSAAAMFRAARWNYAIWDTSPWGY